MIRTAGLSSVDATEGLPASFEVSAINTWVLGPLQDLIFVRYKMMTESSL